MTPLIREVRRVLAARENPERAAGQQAYMRSQLPYYGLTMPELRRAVAAVLTKHPLSDRAMWERTIREMWDGATHREEWYAAIALARFRRYEPWAVEMGSLPIWEHLLRTGAWWDVCDEITEHLISPMLAAHPETMTTVLRAWSRDPHRWVRRAAILAQNRRRSGTDPALLEYCLTGSLDDQDFFSRKAIGWALREFSKTDPNWVRAYVAAHGERLSGLSRREATRLIR